MVADGEPLVIDGSSRLLMVNSVVSITNNLNKQQISITTVPVDGHCLFMTGKDGCRFTPVVKPSSNAPMKNQASWLIIDWLMIGYWLVNDFSMDSMVNVQVSNPMSLLVRVQARRFWRRETRGPGECWGSGGVNPLRFSLVAMVATGWFVNESYGFPGKSALNEVPLLPKLMWVSNKRIGESPKQDSSFYPQLSSNTRRHGCGVAIFRGTRRSLAWCIHR